MTRHDLIFRLANDMADGPAVASVTAEEKRLLTLSDDELWDAYLTWNGVIGFSSRFHEAHEAIFGSSS